MSIQKTIQGRLRVVVLVLVTVSLFALAGCGTDAPQGSTISVTAWGSPIITDVTNTVTATKTQNYRVSVTDGAALPLNGIDVNILGQFTNGQSINFGGAVASVPTTSVPGAQVSVTLTTTQTTDNFGYVNFAISAPYYAVTKIHVPYNQDATGSETGGQLTGAAGGGTTYYYTVTALDVLGGETEATAPVSALVSGATGSAVTTGSATVTWQAVPGAVSYRIYGRTGPAVSTALIDILDPNATSWTDTGSATEVGATVPSVNTTGLSLNSIVGSGQATTGPALATFSISF